MTAHPYRTAAEVHSSGVMLAARVLRPRVLGPIGIPVALTALTIFLIGLVLGTSGCAFFQQHPDDAGLAAKDAACVAFQLALGNEDPLSIVQVCQLPQDALKIVEDMLSAQKKGLAAKRAEMAADAGAEAGK